MCLSNKKSFLLKHKKEGNKNIELAGWTRMR